MPRVCHVSAMHFPILQHGRSRILENKQGRKQQQPVLRVQEVHRFSQRKQLQAKKKLRAVKFLALGYHVRICKSVAVHTHFHCCYCSVRRSSSTC